MKNSCNGCRVLRKGCSDDCTLRPCLDWIKSAESQANATLFLAKFYGRAGLINLINGGPNHLSPEIFRSLLYEACGRIVNPVSGSVGLMWSNNWDKCQSAVDSVLSGTPLAQSWPQDGSEVFTMPFYHQTNDQTQDTFTPDPVTELQTGPGHDPSMLVVKCEPESAKENEIGLELSLGLNGATGFN